MNSRQEEREQQYRVRPYLTKQDSKKKRAQRKAALKKYSRRVPKQAPGHKRLASPTNSHRKFKSKKAKQAVQVRQTRQRVHKLVIDHLKHNKTHPAEVRHAFVQEYLASRMLDPDVDDQNWLDWLEGEVYMLNEALRREGLLKDET